MLKDFKKQCFIPKHRNLANIYSAWEEKRRIFVQMELGANGCLAKIVAKNQKNKTLLPEKQIWKFFIDILLVNFLKFCFYLFYFNFRVLHRYMRINLFILI